MNGDKWQSDGLHNQSLNMGQMAWGNLLEWLWHGPVHVGLDWRLLVALSLLSCRSFLKFIPVITSFLKFSFSLPFVVPSVGGEMGLLLDADGPPLPRIPSCWNWVVLKLLAVAAMVLKEVDMEFGKALAAGKSNLASVSELSMRFSELLLIRFWKASINWACSGFRTPCIPLVNIVQIGCTHWRPHFYLQIHNFLKVTGAFIRHQEDIAFNKSVCGVRWCHDGLEDRFDFVKAPIYNFGESEQSAVDESKIVNIASLITYTYDAGTATDPSVPIKGISIMVVLSAWVSRSIFVTQKRISYEQTMLYSAAILYSPVQLQPRI